MKYSILVLPFLFFQYCRSQTAVKIESNPDDNTLLWEISGKDLAKPSYLFGTFHLMCKEDIKLSDNLKKAISKSKELYFEMDLDDPANTLGAMFFMNMKNGTTLKDLYTDEEYARVSAYFKDNLQAGMMMMMEKMKPALLQSFLYPKLMPCKNMSGVEMEIIEFAKDQKKEIKGFETIEFQTSVFDSIPYKDQAKDLIDMIDSIDAYKGYFNKMLSVYKGQHLGELQKMLNDPQFNTDEKNQEMLLDKRNENWVSQLNDILPATPLFIAVGAGHLVGNKGLINLLKQAGYTLRPLLNK